MTNRPKDLDMSDVIADAQDAWDEEYDRLDLPHLSIDIILITLGDAMDIDPLALLDAYASRNPSTMADMRTAHGANDVNAMTDLIDEGIDSSLQIDHIRRGIEMNLNRPD